MLEAHKSIKIRLDATVDTLLDYQEDQARVNIAKDYFIHFIQNSGFDAKGLWWKSYKAADTWIDAVLADEQTYIGVTPDDLDEESWLAEVLRLRGLPIPDRRESVVDGNENPADNETAKPSPVKSQETPSVETLSWKKY